MSWYLFAFVIPARSICHGDEIGAAGHDRVDEIVDMASGGADHCEQLGLVTDPLGEREPVEQRRAAWLSLQPDPVGAGLGQCEAPVEHLIRRR